MLAGRPPVRAETPVALVREQEAPPPLIAGVSPGLTTIALAALRPSPAERIGSAADLAAALRGWLSTGVVPAGIAPPIAAGVDPGITWAATIVSTRTSRPAPTVAAPRRRWSRQLAVWVSLVGVAALLAVGALASRPDAPPRDGAPSGVAAGQILAVPTASPAPSAASPAASAAASPTPPPPARSQTTPAPVTRPAAPAAVAGGDANGRERDGKGDDDKGDKDDEGKGKGKGRD